MKTAFVDDGGRPMLTIAAAFGALLGPLAHRDPLLDVVDEPLRGQLELLQMALVRRSVRARVGDGDTFTAVPASEVAALAELVTAGWSPQIVESAAALLKKGSAA